MKYTANSPSLSQKSLGEALDESEFSQDMLGDEIDAPDDPGPAVMGKTPVLGTLRRSQGFPVLRDELKDEYGELNSDILNI